MIVIPLVAWGDAWRLKAKRCIASLGESRVVVYTDKPEDFEVETRPLPKGMGKHKINNACYRLAREEFGAISPIAADMICSAGLTAVLDKHHKAGKRLVVCPVLRAIGEPRSNSPRELARWAIQNQHWRQKNMAVPTTVFRPHGSGLIANCFHAHPLLFDWPVGSSIDSLDGLGVKDIPESQIHVVTDSDEAIVVDVTDENYDWEESEKVSLEEFSKTVLPKHRWIFQHDCHIHYEDLPAA